MPRDSKVYLEEILTAIKKISRYTTGLTLESFSTDEKTVDAVLRNLEIVGEAAKRVPESIRRNHPDVEWKKIDGLRDILIHNYFAVDQEIVWDVVRNNLPDLQSRIEQMLSE